VHLSRLPEFQPTPASAAKLRGRALEARIRAAFMAPAGGGINVTIDVHAGAVTLRGMVISDRERGLAEEITRNVDGVESVDNQVRVIRGTKVFPADI